MYGVNKFTSYIYSRFHLTKRNCNIIISMLQGIISNIYQNNPVHIGKMEIREL